MSKSFLERVKIPHVFVLLVGVILFCTLLTYVMPSGSFERQEKTVGNLTRTIVVPGTYEVIPKHYSVEGVFIPDSKEATASPVSLLQFLSAIPRGMEKSADIIFFIFLIGGVLGILQKTGTVAAFINMLLDTFGNYAAFLTLLLMLLLALGGSTLGMGEEFIPLIPLFLIISKHLGYDRIYAIGIVVLAADIGFASATTNPFTVTIAQGIAELPLNSDIPFRSLFFVCTWATAAGYLLHYGAKIRRDPSKSLMADDPFDLGEHDIPRVPLTGRHISILLSSFVIFVGIMIGIQKFDWWMAEMGGGFFLMGIVAVAISGMSLNDSADAFVKGMEEMVVAALVVGFARGIEIVLSDGLILDTLINTAAASLQTIPTAFAAQGMLVFQTCLNFLIPSGSGQAAVTMPLMAPLADLLEVSRHSAVFAFTCGDGFSNTIVPTSGVLMAILSLGQVPYTRWLKFMMPLFLILMLWSALFLTISVMYPSVWSW